MAADLLAWRWWPIVLAIAGIAARLGWNAAIPAHVPSGEALNIATALANGRGFADAYGPGVGPTAHMLPAGPAFAGVVYQIWPPLSPTAEWVLSLWAASLVNLAFLLLYRAFGHVGVPRTARLVALAACAIAPSYFTTEVIAFRVWDGGVALLVAALFVERLTAMLAGPSVDRFPLPLLASAALLMFVHPLLGCAAAICLVIAGARRFGWRENVRGGVTAVLFAGVLILPWAWRNDQVLGHWVWLRSNAGLELALANDPVMAGASDPEAAFNAQLNRLHPLPSAAARAQVRRVGEVAYSQRLGAIARQWIVTHPAAATRLWLLHVRQAIIPDRWLIDRGRWRFSGVRALYIQTVGVLGALGMIVLAVRYRRRGGWVPGVMIAIGVVLFSPFQPNGRYVYSFYPMLTFLAAGLLATLVAPRQGAAA